MNEEWRLVPGSYHFPYEVSDLGRVRGPTKILKGSPNTKGYRQFNLGTKRAPRALLGHRLVMAAFVGPVPEGHQVDHVNGVKDDNRLENLRYVTAKQNIGFALDDGRVPLGENHRDAVLTWEQVVEIRAIYRPYTPGFQYKDLAEKFGTAKSNIEAIIKLHTWKRDPKFLVAA